MRNGKVYCQILTGAIPVELCNEEQGQAGCKGCDALSRKCEKCKKTSCEDRATGLCGGCTEVTTGKLQKCNRCKKRPQIKLDNPFCFECYNEITAYSGAEDDNDPDASGLTSLMARAEDFGRGIDVRAGAEMTGTLIAKQSVPPLVKPRLRSIPTPHPPATPPPQIAATHPSLDPPAAAAPKRETVKDFHRRVMKDPHYRAWLKTTQELNAIRIIRRLEWANKPPPMVWCKRCTIKPSIPGENRCKRCMRTINPSRKPGVIHPAPQFTLEEWIERLLDLYLEHDMGYEGGYAPLVLHYDRTHPISRVTLSQYIQDPRIMLLQSARTRKHAPHLLVFHSAEEARSFIPTWDEANQSF